jgi:hypothetical protein
MPAQEGDGFFDYYESKGWLVGKSPMKNWTAAMSTWRRNWGKFNGGPADPQPKAEAFYREDATEMKIGPLIFTRDRPPRRGQFKPGDEGERQFGTYMGQWRSWMEKHGGAK